jgi:hypothetical protein
VLAFCPRNGADRQLGIVPDEDAGNGFRRSIESLPPAGELPEFCSGKEIKRGVAQAADGLAALAERWSSRARLVVASSISDA